MKVKFTILLIISFGMGFALHWLITSAQVRPVSILGQSVAGLASQDQFITYVDYDGKRFKPSYVAVKKGNYLAITNESKDQLMWLVSDNPDLQTPRGYGEGEKLQVILLKEGRHKVVNRLDTEGFLEIVVEP